MAEAPKQFLFVSHREVNVGSTSGRSILFEKGRPTHVPREMHAEVMARGIMPCDEKGTLQAAEDPKAAPDKAMAPEDPEDRAAAILEALKLIAERNSARDFSAGGVPRADVVSPLLGWRVDEKDIRPI